MMVSVAPRKRLPVAQVRAVSHQLDVDTLGLHVLEELPTPVLLVNRNHQIVYANRELLGMTGEDSESVLGLRPGEAIRCENACVDDAGCGCAEVCSTCGAVTSILSCFQGQPNTSECRITRRGDEGMEALDLRVFSRPLQYGQENYALVHISDISAEKRRQNLEKIFFHDILNVVGSIRGFTEILLDYNLDNPREILEQLHDASQQMVEEVEAQRLLSRAEHGDIEPQREPLESLQVLERVVTLFKGHEVARGRELRIDPASCREIFISDHTLLVRALVNLAKNALEAIPSGEEVLLSCSVQDDRLAFHVRNPGVIPAEVQMQIFQRSFSTKGGGRGIGTYSVRLLVERYLGGGVTFISSASAVTCFTITLPVAV